MRTDSFHIICSVSKSHMGWAWWHMPSIPLLKKHTRKKQPKKIKKCLIFEILVNLLLLCICIMYVYTCAMVCTLISEHNFWGEFSSTMESRNCSQATRLVRPWFQLLHNVSGQQCSKYACFPGCLN